MVKDRNGVEIIPGQTVVVYQKEGVREATVKAVFPDRPTFKESGFWVDIDFGDGLQGMMSYILEVKNNNKLKMDDQGAGCPHCGHYCTGKTAFCNPLIKSAT